MHLSKSPSSPLVHTPRAGKIALIAAIATVFSPPAAFAASSDRPTELDAISVAADFRPTDLQEAPSSISTVDELQIEDRAAQHVEDVINLVPNVNFASGSNRARYFQIRGIGERSQFKAPINPSVGVMIDGIDLSGIGTAATLFDIRQVDVLRGPQGTRYGSSALAGLINLSSEEPSEHVEAKVQASVADFNTRSLGIAAGGPLVAGKLLGRIALHKNTSDGYITNTFLNREDTNNRDELTTRGKLRWLASNDLIVDLTLMHIDIDNGYDAFTLDDIAYETQSDQPGRDTQTTDAAAINVKWDANRRVRLESTLAYSSSDAEYSYDEDWSHVGLHADEYSSFDQYLRDHDNTTLDVRLLSNKDGRIFNDSSDWVLGFYHADKSQDLTRKYTYLAGDFSSQYDTRQDAVYGQLDTALGERLTLTSGLRYENWEADYDDSDAVNVSTSEGLWGGKLGLEYQQDEGSMVYASLSRGFKAGGVNTDGSLPASARDFGTEYLWNLETGLKHSSADNRLQSRIAVFYGKRRDQQVKSSFVLPRADGSTEFVDFIDNAAEGKNYGLEAEFSWLPTDDWHLFANLGLLRTNFDRYTDPNGIDVEGRDQAQSPRYQFAVGGDYYINDRWSMQASVEGKDGFYFSDRHNAKSDAYALLNASLSYSVDNWRLSLWGRNLTDEQYATRGFGSFGNDPRNGYITETYTQLGEPRIVGLSASWNY